MCIAGEVETRGTGVPWAEKDDWDELWGHNRFFPALVEKTVTSLAPDLAGILAALSLVGKPFNLSASGLFICEVQLITPLFLSSVL